MLEVSSEDRIPQDVRVVRDVYRLEKVEYYNASLDKDFEVLLETKPFIREVCEEFRRKAGGTDPQ